MTTLTSTQDRQRRFDEWWHPIKAELLKTKPVVGVRADETEQQAA